jgi:hypothetical protein
MTESSAPNHDLCTRCGALTGDQGRHSQWHEGIDQLDKRLTQLIETVRRDSRSEIASLDKRVDGVAIWLYQVRQHLNMPPN